MHSIVAWFARNHIAANLLMVLILVSGTLSIFQLKKEFIPSFTLDTVLISVPYPGAAPSEVETAINLRVEEAIDGLDGIKRINSSATAGMASLSVEINPDYDTDNVLSEIKTRIDAITSFPADVERPLISKPSIRSPVIQVILSGPLDEHNLRQQAEIIREEMSYLPSVSQVELSTSRPYEISIEISELALQRYQLNMQDISNAIRGSSFDLPAGSIKSRSGDVLLRTKDQAYSGHDFADIIIRSDKQHGSIRLRDIAQIRDDFADNDISISLDNNPAITLLVYRVGDQDILKIAESVRNYIDEKNTSLPPDSSLHVWRDESLLYQGRLNTLTSNAVGGLILVFLVLMLFLGAKLAFWVALGIPISFMGALAVMNVLGESLNMISMFAFLLVIGIVVDDAIVVGESVHSAQERDKKNNLLNASIAGAYRVGRPVFFAVATTIVAFAPMLFLPGVDGKFWHIIPVVVIGCLAFSLVESLCILPAHLGHPSRVAAFFSWWAQPFKAPFIWLSNKGTRLQQGFSAQVERFVTAVYLPSLRWAIHWRYLTVSIFVMLFMILIGLMMSNRIKVIFFPNIEADTITVNLEMPIGTPINKTPAVTDRIMAAGHELQTSLRNKMGKEILTHFYVMTGAQTNQGRESANTSTSSHLAQIIAELDQESTHDISAQSVTNSWRALCGDILGIKSLTFESQFMHGNYDVQVQITGPSLEELKIVSNKLIHKLNDFSGVHDITNNFPFGKDEIQLKLTDRGKALGVDQLQVTRQVQAAFFGSETQRIQRGRDEVRVYLRYPREDRSSLADLMHMYISHQGEHIPLNEIAELSYGSSYASINRQDRRRVVMITAKIDHSVQNADIVNKDFMAFFETTVKKEHPLVNLKNAGKQEDRADLVKSLGTGLIISMLVVYALIAIAFNSYVQPAIIMSAIPFGLIGAVAGHMVMGLPVSMLSILGIIALTGVVVNDSLVLVDGINRHHEEGMGFRASIIAAGQSRFRAIILTTLTTFFGLFPLMMETSVQSQFLIPMAASLAYGVIFATLITLILVPALTAIVDDFRKSELSTDSTNS